MARGSAPTHRFVREFGFMEWRTGRATDFAMRAFPELGSLMFSILVILVDPRIEVLNRSLPSCIDRSCTIRRIACSRRDHRGAQDLD